MKLAIFTLVSHKKKDGKYFGYAPYVREMDLWNSHFEEVLVVAPLSKNKSIDPIDISYQHSKLKLITAPIFNIKSLSSILRLVYLLPKFIVKIVRVMRQADHIHFRSPSNIAAVAGIVQIFFPKKKKTMRYAGNWDPNSRQPVGYRFQKWLFSNSFLTRNINVLVYGNWANTSKNITPFFAATFHNNEKENFKPRDYEHSLDFIFMGTLVSGKRPLLTIKIIEKLKNNGIACKLHMFGDGPLKHKLEHYVLKNQLEQNIMIYGNQPKSQLKEFLKQSHFTILPSQSEGWPKVLAEGMFFGSIPISTKISCVDWMLGYGERGILIEANVTNATETILDYLKNGKLNDMAKAAQQWSQNYTVEKQEEEIKRILGL